MTMSGENQRSVLLLVVALPAEARPLINRLKLARVNEQKRPYYENGEFGLIISGVGPRRAKEATIEAIKKLKPLAICNIGVCGSREEKIQIGTTICINQIRDNKSGEGFYPDILFKHNFREEALVSYDKPQGPDSGNYWQNASLVDMEASAIANALLNYSGPHCYQVLKIVSDHLQEEYLDANFVESLVESNMRDIYQFLIDLKSILVQIPSLSIEDMRELWAWKDRFKFTATQINKLKRLCVHRVSKGFINIDTLGFRVYPRCQNKIERDKLFKKFCRELLQ